MSQDPLDTRVVNGRFVGPDAPANSTLTIHDGVVVDEPDRDVWRTVNASGHLVFPGLIQPSGVLPDDALVHVRKGVTTAILSGGDSGEGACLDYLPADGSTITIVEPDDQSSLSDDDWELLAGDAPVHFQAPALSTFPVIHFLYHEGHVRRSISLQRIADLTSGNLARHRKVFPQKGSFGVGSDGDLFVFDPDSDDPYNELAWPGRVIFSLLRGQILLYNGQVHTESGDGLRIP